MNIGCQRKKDQRGPMTNTVLGTIISATVASWEDCGRVCVLTTTCKFWSWGKDELIDHNNCYLYANGTGLEFNLLYISGERGCPENQGC